MLLCGTVFPFCGLRPEAPLAVHGQDRMAGRLRVAVSVLSLSAAVQG